MLLLYRESPPDFTLLSCDLLPPVGKYLSLEVWTTSLPHFGGVFFVPRRMRIAVHGCTVKGTGESLLPSVLSRVGTRGYIVKRRYFTLEAVGINSQD